MPIHTYRQYLKDIVKVMELKQAKEWQETEDQYVYCLDQAGLSADSKHADWFVAQMEARFQELLEEDSK